MTVLQTEPVPRRITEEERAERVRRITAHPSYRLAEEDAELTTQPDLVSVRLLLEFTKTQRALEQEQVRSTIVLFGSTRLCEPAEAARRRDLARAALAERPDDPELARRARVAERIVALSRYYDVARDFASMASQRCQQPGSREFVIVTGGGPGIMEAGNRGAAEAGRATAGFNIHLPMEQAPNAWITPGLCFRFHYFALRKMHFMRIARALVAFPGGFGTMDELFETLCLIQTRTIDPLPVVLVGEAFWRRAFDVEFLADEGVIEPDDRSLFTYAETAEEIWSQIETFWRLRGQPPPGGACAR